MLDFGGFVKCSCRALKRPIKSTLWGAQPRWRFDLQVQKIFLIRCGMEITYCLQIAYNNGEYFKDNKFTKYSLFFLFLLHTVNTLKWLDSTCDFMHCSLAESEFPLTKRTYMLPTHYTQWLMSPVAHVQVVSPKNLLTFRWCVSYWSTCKCNPCL